MAVTIIPSTSIIKVPWKYILGSIHKNLLFLFLILFSGLSYGATDEELRQYEERVKNYPNIAEAHLQLALAYDENQLLTRAKEEYIQAISLNDTLQIAYINLAVIYLREGNYADANRYFQKTLELNPIRHLLQLHLL